MNGSSPLLLSSNVKEENDFLVVDLTNPVLPLADGRVLPHGTIHLVRTIFLWEGDCFERTEISNFALQPVSLSLQFDFQADYVDLFEIRGTARKKRGQLRTLRVHVSTISETFWESHLSLAASQNVHVNVTRRTLTAKLQNSLIIHRMPSASSPNPTARSPDSPPRNALTPKPSTACSTLHAISTASKLSTSASTPR